jgi:hypothetical protein
MRLHKRRRLRADDYPGLTAWAIFCRAYGAETVVAAFGVGAGCGGRICQYLARVRQRPSTALRAGKRKRWRADDYPGLTAWAIFCRVYGAGSRANQGSQNQLIA